MKPFYITTPIYYASDAPHLGHAYTTIVADALARHARLRGREVGFLTGTDEHGQKMARAAAEHDATPKAYADRVVQAYHDAWKALDISHDDFIRTTDPDHQAVVRELWQKLEHQGDIYLGEYEGWYCVPCEQFYLEKELTLSGEQHLCPVHNRPVEQQKEQSYFFRLSKYAERLLAHYAANPTFIQPETRRNEVLAFVKRGLEDLSVSRSNFDWGIPVPDKPGHVIYVWIDALTNYYSATRRQKLAGMWDDGVEIVHLIGKEISRFHAIYWPAMLMAAGLRLPDVVFCHGWWTVNGDKMSKTQGNVVDPVALGADLGVDALRYFVLREVPLGLDGDFAHTALLTRYNAELCNDLGNLLNRTLGMVTKYFAPERIVLPRASSEPPEAFAIADALASVDGLMGQRMPSMALDVIWGLVRAGNAYIDKEAPWKATSDKQLILGNVLELCRVLAHVLSPFIPAKARAMLAQLGLESEKLEWPMWSPRGYAVREGVPLFPRIEKDQMAALLDKWRPRPAVPALVEPAHDKTEKTAAPGKAAVSFDEFQRFDLRVAQVLTAAAVPKAKKLLQLSLDVGDGRARQVVAGIAERYAPADLVGKKVIFLANLQPATIRGILSEGMVLAAGGDSILGLSSVDADAPPGTPVR